FALAGSPPIQLPLNFRFGEVDLRRATIDHHTDPAAVRFAERRDPKELTEAIAHESENLDQHRVGTTRAARSFRRRIAGRRSGRGDLPRRLKSEPTNRRHRARHASLSGRTRES